MSDLNLSFSSFSSLEDSDEESLGCETIHWSQSQEPMLISQPEADTSLASGSVEIEMGNTDDEEPMDYAQGTPSPTDTEILRGLDENDQRKTFADVGVQTVARKLHFD